MHWGIKQSCKMLSGLVTPHYIAISQPACPVPLISPDSSSHSDGMNRHWNLSKPGDETTSTTDIPWPLRGQFSSQWLSLHWISPPACVAWTRVWAWSESGIRNIRHPRGGEADIDILRPQTQGLTLKCWTCSGPGHYSFMAVLWGWGKRNLWICHAMQASQNWSNAILWFRWCNLCAIYTEIW